MVDLTDCWELVNLHSLVLCLFTPTAPGPLGGLPSTHRPGPTRLSFREQTGSGTSGWRGRGRDTPPRHDRPLVTLRLPGAHVSRLPCPAAQRVLQQQTRLPAPPCAPRLTRVERASPRQTEAPRPSRGDRPSRAPLPRPRPSSLLPRGPPAASSLRRTRLPCS